MMAKSDYFEAIQVQKSVMVATGIWPNENSGLLYKTYGFVLSFVFQIVFIAPCLLKVSFDPAHAAKGSYYLFCVLTVFSYCIKIVSFYLNKNSFYKILDDLEQPLFSSYPSELKVYMERAVLLSVRIRKLIYYPCVIFVSFIAMCPAFEKGSSRPLPFALPLDTGKMPFSLYVLLYGLESIASAVCASNNVTLDTLVYSLIALGTAQLQILVASLEVSTKTDTEHEDLERKLKNCIEHHIKIINYVANIEDTFSYVFLAQFLTSLVVIGVTGFSIMVIPVSDILFPTAASYFIAAMMEVSIYCILGDELIVQSLKVAEACYMTNWHHCGTETRKIMLTIMERSKRPIVLTARKFANLSRESLVTICKTSYSYFTLLRRMYDPE